MKIDFTIIDLTYEPVNRSIGIQKICANNVSDKLIDDILRV